jgi:hypothetical protein
MAAEHVRKAALTAQRAGPEAASIGPAPAPARLGGQLTRSIARPSALSLAAVFRSPWVTTTLPKFFTAW